jgi:hypothetical protein
MIPGQLGPTKRDLLCAFNAFMTCTMHMLTKSQLHKKMGGCADLYLVLLGDALSDGDDEGDLILDGFDDCVCRCRRGHVDHRCIGLGLLYSLETHPLSEGDSSKSREVANLAHASKNGQTQVGLTGFLGGDTANHVGTILECLGDVERRLWVSASRPRRAMGVSWRARLPVGRWLSAPSCL